MRKTLVSVVMVALAVSACARVPAEQLPSPPATDVVVLVEPGSAPALAAKPERRGLLARLSWRNRVEPEPQDIQLADALISEGAEAVETQDAPEIAAALAAPDTEATFLDEVQDAIAESQETAPSEPPATEATAPRRGLFARLRGGSNTTKTSSEAPATEFGQLARLCDFPKSQMGTEVARSPGQGTYRLYDSAPNSTAPRAQFVTGFKDGCVRQFTAVLALFGSPVVHETKRYDPRNKRAYTAADAAYEDVKGRVCKVRQGTPCPADRVDALGRDVALFTAYSSFGEAREWFDVVLYKGDVAGKSVEQ